MPKSQITIALLCVALGITYIFLLTWEDRSTYYISTSHDFDMLDEEVIAVAKECLKLDGRDVGSFHLVPYGSDANKLISSDMPDNSQVHLLWHESGSSNYYNYYVEIERQQDSQVKCVVGQPH